MLRDTSEYSKIGRPLVASFVTGAASKIALQGGANDDLSCTRTMQVTQTIFWHGVMGRGKRDESPNVTHNQSYAWGASNNYAPTSTFWATALPPPLDNTVKWMNLQKLCAVLLLRSQSLRPSVKCLEQKNNLMPRSQQDSKKPRYFDALKYFRYFSAPLSNNMSHVIPAKLPCCWNPFQAAHQTTWSYSCFWCWTNSLLTVARLLHHLNGPVLAAKQPRPIYEYKTCKRKHPKNKIQSAKTLPPLSSLSLSWFKGKRLSHIAKSGKGFCVASFGLVPACWSACVLGQHETC